LQKRAIPREEWRRGTQWILQHKKALSVNPHIKHIASSLNIPLSKWGAHGTRQRTVSNFIANDSVRMRGKLRDQF
jgi:hypothetical protein